MRKSVLYAIDHWDWVPFFGPVILAVILAFLARYGWDLISLIR